MHQFFTVISNSVMSFYISIVIVLCGWGVCIFHFCVYKVLSQTATTYCMTNSSEA